MLQEKLYIFHSDLLKVDGSAVLVTKALWTCQVQCVQLGCGYSPLLGEGLRIGQAVLKQFGTSFEKNMAIKLGESLKPAHQAS